MLNLRFFLAILPGLIVSITCAGVGVQLWFPEMDRPGSALPFEGSMLVLLGGVFLFSALRSARVHVSRHDTP